jgi:hypothetical protein
MSSIVGRSHSISSRIFDHALLSFSTVSNLLRRKRAPLVETPPRFHR